MKHHGLAKTVLTVFVLTALPLSAKPKTTITATVVYDSVNVLQQVRLGKGRIGVRLLAEGLAWTDVDPADPGVVAIKQVFDIAINIDHTSAGIVGRTAAVLTGPMFPSGWETRLYQVRGTIDNCAEGSCALTLVSRSADMRLRLDGRISIDPASGDVTITDMGGVIVLRFGGQDLGE